MTAEDVRVTSLIVRGEHEAAAAALRRPGFAVEAFGAFAERHRVAGLFWTLAAGSPLEEVVPPALRERWRAYYLRQWAKNERLVREAERLAAGLAAAAPRHLFMKGPFFAERFYGDIDRRAISDLDVLVADTGELRAVDALLRGAGYRRTSLGGPRSVVARRFAHHFTYRRDDLAVEVHWAFQQHFTFAIDYDAVRRARRAATLHGRHYAVTSDEDELVLQLLAVVTDAQVGTFRMKTLVDVYMVLRAIAAETAWDAFLDRRTRQGLGRIASSVLATTLDLLDCALEFPSLTAALARRPEARRIRDPLAFLDAKRLDLAAKVRSFSLYQAPLPLCVLAWAVSLPVRAAVHRDDAVAGVREAFR